MTNQKRFNNTFKNKLHKVSVREMKHDTLEGTPNSANPFYETKVMFRDALGIYESLSYEEWLAFEPQDKAAALYVNFYSQITFAWYKCRSFYGLEEDGVSTVLQYLQKNVPIIENDERRFTPNYIYRVAYNCMYCICHDIKRDRERWENETSNIVSVGENEEVNLFDTVKTESFESLFENEVVRIHFWKVVESLGDDVVTFVDGILSGTTVPKKIRNRSDEIMQELATRLAPFQSRL